MRREAVIGNQFLRSDSSGVHVKSIQTLLLVLAGLLLTVDLAHGMLNAIYRPYEGALDNVMHLALAITPFVYMAAVFVSVYALTRVFARSTVMVPPVVLLVLLGAEVAFTILVLPRSGSSSYRPMFPDFAAGPIIGALTIATAQPFLNSRSVRILVSAVFCLWCAGTMVTDSLWYSEATRRGTGPLWEYPVLSTALGGFAFVILGADLVPPMAELSSTVLAYIGILLTVVVMWGFWRNRQRHLAVSALALSVGLLVVKLTEWAQFIAD